MAFSDVEIVYRKIAQAARKAGGNSSSVVCNAPEPRLRGHVINISSTVPINISELAHQFPGAQIYARPDRQLMSLEVGYDVLSVYGPTKYFLKWWMLIAVWIISGAIWAHTVLRI